MSEHDPAEQIAEALQRLRWQGPRGWGGPALGRLVAVLVRAGGPLSVSELAERVGVDQPRASRLVAQGVEHGLLRREADPSDARRTRIALTEQGDAMAQRMRGMRGESVRQALAEFSDEDRAQLASLLARLADAWPHGRGRGRGHGHGPGSEPGH